MYSCWDAASTAANTLSSSHSERPVNTHILTHFILLFIPQKTYQEQMVEDQEMNYTHKAID